MSALAQCTPHFIQFMIFLSFRTYQLKAESYAEAESWVSALRHTQVSGIPLSEQLLTSNKIPVIIHKCLQFIESTGMDVEGLYRISGEKAKIRKLILAFNQGKDDYSAMFPTFSPVFLFGIFYLPFTGSK